MTFFPLSLLFKEYSIKFPSKDKIIILTANTLGEALNTYENLLILMYTPLNQNYNTILQDLEKTVKEKIINKMNVTFAKIDIEHHVSIAEKYNLKDIPKVILFINGKIKEIYDYNIDKDSLIEWLYKRLGLYKNGKIYNLPPISLSVQSNITIALNSFPEEFEKNIEELFYVNINKLLIFLSTHNHEPILLFLKNSSDLNNLKFDEMTKKKVLQAKEKIKYSIGEFNDSNIQKILNDSKIRLSDEELPTAIIFDIDKNNWIFNDFFDDYNETNLELFIENWANKKLKILMRKSEEKPGKQESGRVYKIVYKTFKRDVLNNNLNVFVKFYMPNDTLCKEIEPVYENLASELKINGNIRIAEYNLESNYFDYIKIDHYPTLILFRAGYKEKDELLEYKGEKKAYDMIYWILTHQEFPILNKKKKRKNKENTEEIKDDL